MIATNSIYDEMFNSAARHFVGRVEHLDGSTLLNLFEHDGALINFTIDKTSDNTKFFGYGISQILTMKLRDKERAINIEEGQYLQAAFGIENDYVYHCTMFIVDDVERDENTNELTVKALDPIYTASGHLVKELQLPDKFTLRTFAILCGAVLGMPVNFINIPDALLNVEYTKEQANFDGEETIRQALDNLAEMFGAIYYFCNNWNITFKGLDVEGEPVLIIDKSKYFELSAKSPVTLTNLMSVTELGDNVATISEVPGETQYLRENAFLVLRDDIGTLLENILSAVQGMTIGQITCKHRGDFRLEIGDKIAFEAKDGSIVPAYLLTDSITYNGGVVGNTVWDYAANVNETESNPTSLGEALKMTYARVDKVNQEITLLAKRVDESDVGQVTEQLASLKLTTDSITAEVHRIESDTNKAIETLADEVSATITEDEVTFLISQEISDGVTAVTTTTGFEFNEAGLTIAKTGHEMYTKITENGMEVIRTSDNNRLLTCNSQGVTARDLTATTYLNAAGSRFEKYELPSEIIGPTHFTQRTGCFWIGGIY